MTPSPTRHATEQWYPVTPSSFETSTFHNGTTSKFPHGFHKISSLSPFLSSLQINTPQGHCPELMIFCIVTLIRTSLPLWHCHSYITDTLHIVFIHCKFQLFLGTKNCDQSLTRRHRGSREGSKVRISRTTQTTGDMIWTYIKISLPFIHTEYFNTHFFIFPFFPPFDILPSTLLY